VSCVAMRCIVGKGREGGGVCSLWPGLSNFLSRFFSFLFPPLFSGSLSLLPGLSSCLFCTLPLPFPLLVLFFPGLSPTPYGLRPTMTLRPTAYALRPTPYALR